MIAWLTSVSSRCVIPHRLIIIVAGSIANSYLGLSMYAEPPSSQIAEINGNPIE